MEKISDYLIIGAGIVGLSFAYHIKKRHPNATVTLLEKEATIGLHASGRNSGVLHSGIYYPKGTLKATLCAKGAALHKQFCREHQLPCKAIGKVIIPTEASLDNAVDTLFDRGKSNGVSVEVIDQQRLKQLEPEAKTASNRALFLSEASVVDSKAIIQTLLQQLQAQRVDIRYQTQITQIDSEKNCVHTNHGTLPYQQLINAAGAHADKIATLSGLSHDYVMLPFRGVYFKVTGTIAKNIRHLIYPVPNLDMPFLGVHTTTDIHGNVYLGPTAMPSFGRENYTTLNGFDAKDSLQTLMNIGKMYLSNTQGIRKHMHHESKTLLFKKHLLQRAQQLLPNLTIDNIQACNKRGIRPQLYDKQNNQLVMDFVVKKQDNITHILNAISPAFTSSLAFAEHVLTN